VSIRIRPAIWCSACGVGRNASSFTRRRTRPRSIARNLGIDRARGQFLVFANGDIEIDPGWQQPSEAFTSVQPAPGAIAGQLDAKYLAPK
jgi:glycosyltransferase involved in cell wall biosynthesis